MDVWISVSVEARELGKDGERGREALGVVVYEVCV